MYGNGTYNIHGAFATSYPCKTHGERFHSRPYQSLRGDPVFLAALALPSLPSLQPLLWGVIHESEKHSQWKTHQLSPWNSTFLPATFTINWQNSLWWLMCYVLALHLLVRGRGSGWSMAPRTFAGRRLKSPASVPGWSLTHTMKACLCASWDTASMQTAPLWHDTHTHTTDHINSPWNPVAAKLKLHSCNEIKHKMGVHTIKWQ